MLWAYLPEYFLGYLLDAPAPGDPPSGWRYFPQRLDLLATAALILAGALAGGHLLIRALRIPLTRGSAERTAIAGGLGLSACSLATLVLGLCGVLSQGLFVALLSGSVLLETVLRGRDWGKPRSPDEAAAETDASPLLQWSCLAAMTPFVLAMLLGAMIPESDFDVKEYHLEGPKEHFQNGRILFLPHNVYTSFPFLTEMLSLMGMVVRDDWFRGALAGKVVLMSFALLTATAVYAAARRIAGQNAGWIAALIWITTPWAYRISIIAYAEGGLAFYLAASLLAAMLTMERFRTEQPAGSFVVLTGLLAGSAMACKYTGVVSVVIPIGIALCMLSARRSMPSAVPGPPPNDGGRPLDGIALLRTGGLYSAGVLIAVGPWLAKNLLETGNPVYPLLYTVFGGVDWDASLNAKFRAGHRPPDYNVFRLWFWITDVSARNDWLSPLLYGFAPLAWLHRPGRRSVAGIWLFVVYLFATWWLFTHRLDRFWVPMIPAVAVLAGIGAVSIGGRRWELLRTGVILACVPFNLQIVTSVIGGPNAYLIDIEAARPRIAGYAMTYLNERLPPGSKVLCVGHAEVFDATVPVIYNTVFDRSIFQEWCARPDASRSDAELELRDAESIRAKLREEGVTHVLVNWSEILRYRTTYGYTEFVTPERFAELRAMEILGPPTMLGQGEIERLLERDREELRRWGRALTGSSGNPALWTTIELYPVSE